MTLEQASDVFCDSFAAIRSITFPFEYMRIGPLRVLRDVTRRARGARAEEIIACGCTPEQALRAINRYKPPRHFVCAITPADEAPDAKLTYKAGGYRAMGSEKIMARGRAPISIEQPSIRAELRRVVTSEDAEMVFKAARRRQIREEDLNSENPLIRLYGAFHRKRAVGWVRAIAVHPKYPYVSNMYVVSHLRRKGIGRALLAMQLEDDQRLGAEASVLVASTSGALLYDTLGYKTLGVLQLFSPRK
jgi:hypothetical protein